MKNILKCEICKKERKYPNFMICDKCYYKIGKEMEKKYE